MIPEGVPHLTAYLSELLRTNKPEQQSNTFRFPTPENPSKIGDHTPKQTRILKKLRELQEEEELNPKDDVESRMQFSKRFDWIDTLLAEIENQVVENILDEYHETYVRHTMDIGKNTESRILK